MTPDITSRINYTLNEDIARGFEELSVAITSGVLNEAVKQVRSGKSSVEDLLLNESFIYGHQELMPYVLHLFNCDLYCAIFPDAWSDVLLVPLHKKGNVNAPDNYRGIARLSVLGKLFTPVLNNWLMAESYGILVEAQNGFQAKRGTVDSIIILHTVINKFLDEGNSLYSLSHPSLVWLHVFSSFLPPHPPPPP